MNRRARPQPQVAADHDSVTLHRSIHTHTAAHGHQVAAGAPCYANGTAHTNGVAHRLVGTYINGFANAHRVVAVLGGNIGREEERSSEEQPAKGHQYGKRLHGRLQLEGTRMLGRLAANISRAVHPCQIASPSRGSGTARHSAGLGYNDGLAAILVQLFGGRPPMIQTLFGTVEPSFLDRMKQAVTRTRENLSERLEDVVSFHKEIDRSTLDDLEATLIGADLGTTTTHEVLDKLREKADRKQIKDVAELKRLLKEELLAILNQGNARPVQKVEGEPEVILVVGVNGTGKTTTIGKLANVLHADGKSVLLCAADTFRAAAIEQLEIWGTRTGTEVIKTKPGGDPAAVLFDALQAAKARQTDYVIVDTAGRLHTKVNLMAELEKMRRTAQRIIPGAPHETLLIMDATTGQNGLQQARLFTQSSGVTGIVLTKLDGTAKGGVVVAITRELGLPVRYVGVGEKAGDLLPFDPQAFVDSLFE
jgi:fused signal recognition particle receptor